MANTSDRDSAARELAVTLLARREHSVQELTQKLARRGYQEDSITQALEWCQHHDLQSDDRFAEIYVRHRASQLYGPLHIQSELRQRGIDDMSADDTIKQAAINWSDNALQFLHKRNQDLTDYAAQGKAYQALCRKGFTSSQARAALSEYQSHEGFD